MTSLVNTNRFGYRKKLLAVSGIFAVWYFLYRGTLASAWHLARADEGHSHLMAIPLLAAYFFFIDRDRIFSSRNSAPLWQKVLSVGFLASGGGLFVAVTLSGAALAKVDNLSFLMASAVLVFLGSFLGVLGEINLKRAAFPGLLLLGMVPIPGFVRNAAVSFLVHGSADVTGFLFHLTGTTFYREGTSFLLPGVSIEIADACSGIRSSIGLLLTFLIASRMFLKRWWSKAALIALIVPMVLIKNGIRITTLTLLAVHVDKLFLVNSPLHRSGGILFFALALLLTLPVLVLLRKLEGRKDEPVFIKARHGVMLER